MKNSRITGVVIACLGLFLGLSVGSVQAAFIGGSSINPSTTLSAVDPWTIDQIADGITADIAPDFNGFVSNSASGTISFGLVDGPSTLTNFVLWNDVNVLSEGIKDFNLEFYNPTNALLSTSTTLQGPFNQIDPKIYRFPEINGVSRVDLVVLNSHAGVFTRIEIREVGFNAVPVPAAAWLFGSGLLGLIGISRRKKAS
jgi:hypothetical protein